MKCGATKGRGFRLAEGETKSGRTKERGACGGAVVGGCGFCG